MLGRQNVGRWHYPMRGGMEVLYSRKESLLGGYTAGQSLDGGEIG